MLQTGRRADELITAVRFPAGVGANGAAFREVARRHGDFAIVSVGAVASGGGSVRIGVGGVTDTPRCIEIGAELSSVDVVERIGHLAWELGGYDDVHASARYRRDLVRRIAPKLIGEVRACSA